MRKNFMKYLSMALFFDALASNIFRTIIQDYSPKISEPTIKQNFKHTKTFYQNPIFNQNIGYYNKGIPRSGKNLRNKYISIQVKNRHKRKMLRKGLIDKI